MSKISINKESLPERCEICHQSDEFDAYSNYCQRCAGQQKPNLKLVKQDKEPHLTAKSVMETLKIEQAKWRNQASIDKQKLENDYKKELEKQQVGQALKLEKQRQNIREWRIKNRKKYRETMDFILPYVYPDFDAELLKSRSFEEKLVLSHEIIVETRKKRAEARIYFSAFFVYINLLFYSKLLMTQRDLYDLTASMLTHVIFFPLFMWAIWKKSLPSLRQLYACNYFHYYYKRWNREVNGQEVAFDPSVTTIEECHSSSSDLVKAVYTKNYPA